MEATKLNEPRSGRNTNILQAYGIPYEDKYL